MGLGASRGIGLGQRALNSFVALALAVTMVQWPATPAYAASGYTGGADLVPPQYMLNDHTVYAVHVTGSGLPVSTVMGVSIKLSDTGTSGGFGSAPGFTWSAGQSRWVQSQEAASNDATIATDASGAVSTWCYFKCGDEAFTGFATGNGHGANQAYLTAQIQVLSGGSSYNPTVKPIITILDAKTQGAWVHNGVATGAGAAKRAEALKSDEASVSYSLQKTEANLTDDDSNGIVDDEGYGPVGATGDFRLGVPAGAIMNVLLNQVAWASGQGASAGPADTDIALGASDLTAPAAPGGLHATPGNGAVKLDWTAASDAGGSGLAGYNVYRLVAGTFGDAGLQTGVPRLVGSTTSATTLTDTGLTNGMPYSYYVRAKDNATNVGPRSNQVTGTPVLLESDPPAAVTDLAATAVTADSVTLGWTAPGDDGSVGTATSYDVRYSTGPIPDNTAFDAATQATGEPAPKVAGSSETFAVTGLVAGAHYYFALKAADEVGNVSALSNQADATPVAPATGTMSVNAGAAFTTTIAVSVDSNVPDAVDMRVRDAAGAWSAWQPYAAATPLILTSGDGTKTVEAEYRNLAGTLPLSDTIVLDSTGPEGSVVINEGSAQTSRTVVAIALAASDPNGVPSMRISGDGVFDTETWQAFASTASFTLPAGSGAKMVWVQYRDSLGNISTCSDAIVLNGPYWVTSTPASGGQFYGISFADANNGWAIPSTGIKHTTDGGLTWQTQTSNLGSVSYQTVYALSATTVLASRSSSPDQAVKSTDSGQTWHTVWPGTTPYTQILSFSFIDASHGWASLKNGTVLKTVDGGESWGATVTVSANTTLWRIQMLDASTGWVTGGQGKIFRTWDGGAHWTQQSNFQYSGAPAIYPTARLTGLSVVDTNTAYVTMSQNPANLLLKTVDGGSTWNASYVDGTGATLYDCRFLDANVGWVFNGVSGRIYKTTDGGQTWNTELAGGQGLYYSCFTDASHGWAAGNGGTVVKYYASDTVAPAAVTNLAVTGFGPNSTDLSWTAPVDPGPVGSAHSYDLRYSALPITDDLSFDVATRASSVPAPHTAGTPEAFSVTGLTSGAHYYFALKSADEVNNISPLSNSVEATPGGAPVGTMSVNAGAAYTATTTVSVNSTLMGAVDMRVRDTAGSWSDWQSYAATASLTLTSGDGLKTVEAEYRDGDATTVLSDTITLMTGTPSGTLSISGGAAFTATTGVTVGSSVTGAVDMRLRDAAGTWSTWQSYAATAPLTLTTGDGVKTVEGQYRNEAGTVGTASGTITLDTTGPTGSVSINGGAVATNQTTVLLALAASDPSGVTLMRVSTDGIFDTESSEPFSATSAVILPGGADGPRYVYVQYQDSLGNVSTFSDTIAFDTIGPALSDNAPAGWASGPVSVELFATDTAGVGGLNYSINGAASMRVSGCASSIAAGGSGPIGIQPDGTVVNANGGDTSSWNNIVAVAASGPSVVGLRSDGTVVAAGDNSLGQGNVSGWSNIVAIATGNNPQMSMDPSFNTVGLRSDGTVVATGTNNHGQCDVSGWTDIKSVASGGSFTLGLKRDGTVVVTPYSGDNDPRISGYVPGDTTYGVAGWHDIVAIDAGWYTAVGLKSDGTVVARGGSSNYEQNVSGWTDIVSVKMGAFHTVGLKSDGSVVATGSPNNGRCNVSGWHDIVAIACGDGGTYGLMRDGTVVSTGGDLSGWSLRTAAASLRVNIPVGEGTTTITYSAVDGLGNVSATQTATARIDHTVPVSSTDVTATYIESATINISAEDSVSAVASTHFRIDAGEWTTGTVASNTAIGSHTLDYYSVDLAGNREATQTASFAVLPADPGTMSINGDAERTNTTAVSIDSSVAVAVQMRARNAGGTWGEWTAYAETMAFTLSATDGTKTVEVEYRNAGGDVWPLTDTIILDTTGPTGTIAINGRDVTTADPNVLLTLAASDPAGVMSMRVSNDGVFDTEPWELLADTRAWTLPGVDGNKWVYVQYQDSLGNASVSYIDTIALDRGAPAVSDDAPSGWVNHSVGMTISATDTLSGIGHLDYTVGGVPAAGSGGAGAYIAANTPFTVGLTPEGTVKVATNLNNGEEDARAWTDITAVAAGGGHTVGLKSDGTVVAAGDDDSWWQVSHVATWTGVVAISANSNHSVALMRDGTVIDTLGYTPPPWTSSIIDCSSWRDIVAISAGVYHDLGLKRDGTVVAAGNNNTWGQCNVSGWTDIVGIAGGWGHSVGLKRDGTVVAVGSNSYGQCDVSGWHDIVAISVGTSHTLGLKRDGTVVATGRNDYGQCNVSGWTDIVALAGGMYHSVGIKRDGSCVAVGMGIHGGVYVPGDSWGQTDVGDWTLQPSASSMHYNIPATAEGTTTIDYSAVDLAGNASATQTAEVRIDRNPPFSSTDAVSSYVGTATIHISAEDTCSAVASVNYRLDGGDWTTGSAVSTSAPGVHVLEWAVEDLAGNREANRGLVFTVDSAVVEVDPGPVGTISIDGGAFETYSRTVTLDLAAADPSGVAAMRISNDGLFDSEPWEAFSATHDWTLTSGGGAKTVYVQYMDAAGNVSAFSDVIVFNTNGWTPQPSGVTSDLKSVSDVDANDVWAVGAGGTIVHTADEGLTWTPQTSHTTNDLNSVFFKNATTGWAAGAAGTILGTTDGGTTWVAQSSGTSNDLNSVFFFDTTTGWAVGDAGTVLKTTNGGADWTLQTINWIDNHTHQGTGTSADLYSIQFAGTSGQSGAICGSGGTVFAIDGPTWSLRDAGTTNDLRSIWCVPYETTYVDAWAVGAAGTVKHTPNRQVQWAFGYGLGTGTLTSVDFTGYNNGWITEDAGATGGMWRTADAGGSWTHFDTTHAMNGVSLADANTGFAVGDDGAILRLGNALDATGPSGSISIDGGASETSQTAASLSLTANDANGVTSMRLSTDGVFDTEAWVPYATSATTTLPGGDGEKAVYVQFQDSQGNISTFFDTIVFDAPPVGTMSINAGTSYTTTRAVTIDSDVTGAIEMRKRNTDGGANWGSWTPYSASTTHTIQQGDGLKTVEVQYRDSAGNVLDLTDTITLDTLAPTGTMALNAGASYTATRAVTIDSDVTGATQMRKRNTDGGGNWGDWTPYSASIAHMIQQGDGLKTVEVQYQDDAGNVLDLVDTITLDTAAPTGTMALNAGASYTTTRAVTIDSAVTGATRMRKRNTDGGGNWGDWTPYSASVAHTIQQGDGLKTVEVQYQDDAGNVLELVDTITLDGTKPTTGNNAVAMYAGSASIALAPVDGTGSGVAATWYRFDEGAWTQGTLAATSATGDHALEFYSIDAAGNREATQSVGFLISVGAPVTTISGVPSGWATATVTFSLHPSGDGGAITSHYTLGAGDETTYSAPVLVGTEGTTTVSYWSVDALHQAEVPNSATIRVDSIAPHTTSNAATRYDKSATIVLTGADGAHGSGVAHTYYRLNSGAQTAGTSVHITKAGTYTLRYWSTDIAGNVEAFHTATFVVRAATSVSITSRYASVKRGNSIAFSGSTSSNLAGSTHVEVWAKKPGSSKWVKLSTRHTTSTHHWSYTYRLTARGTWYFQARFTGSSKYAPSTSSSRKITVR